MKRALSDSLEYACILEPTVAWSSGYGGLNCGCAGRQTANVHLNLQHLPPSPSEVAYIGPSRLCQNTHTPVVAAYHRYMMRVICRLD